MTEPHSHLGQLLRSAFARFEAELIDATPPFHGHELRPTHNHVLRNLDADGTRASVLAERAGLSRQAITQIVDELEAAGVVEREADPDDGRAKLVRYTAEGRRSFAESRQRIAAITDRWRSEVGDETWNAFERGLRARTLRSPTCAGRPRMSAHSSSLPMPAPR